MKLDKLFEMTQDKAPNNGLTFAFRVRGSKGIIFVATDKSVSALGLDEQSLLLKIMKTLDYEPTYTTTSIENACFGVPIVSIGKKIEKSILEKVLCYDREISKASIRWYYHVGQFTFDARLEVREEEENDIQRIIELKRQ